MQRKIIVSLSGGKDSTAMLFMMIAMGVPIHAVIFFNTGWEFPEMEEHIRQVDEVLYALTGLRVIEIKPEKSFDYWMYEHPVKARSGPMKGRVHKIGCGWPSAMRRWCTREKVRAIHKHCKQYGDYISAVGYAADEEHRIKDNHSGEKIYPLIEYGMTEQDCIDYCKQLGFKWGGLYDIFRRVSCWCCPLQRIDDLRLLREHRPELWEKLLYMDQYSPSYCPGFKGNYSVEDLEQRFEQEVE